MSACPSRQQLELYLDERLPDAERAHVETHVDDCRACQRALEEAAVGGEDRSLRGLHARHSAETHEPKGDLLMRIAQAGLAGSRSETSNKVVVQVTGPYESPARSLPAVSAVASIADSPTRHAPMPGVVDEDAAMFLHPGTILGQYRILDQLGAGGMGQVYKAVHEAMDRVVALKVIAPHLLRDARARARFQQEVRTAAKLNHANIVMAHDAAEANGLSFLVMEHVEGTTLSTLIAEQGLPPVPLACEIIRQAALGLQHAHDKGMVHRDLKPGNLMVAAQQTAGGGAIVQVPNPRGTLPGWPTAPLVKILDFGVARLRQFGPHGEPLKMKTLTQEGCVVGTPEFMSPEQACDSRSVDIRSDIYSLGCTLYFLLTGRPPFSGATALETMVQHLKQPLPPVGQLRPGLAPGLVAVVHRMLAKSADERYQTPAEVAEALRPWTGDFASSVAPDVLMVQRGLADTAPASLAAAHTASPQMAVAPLNDPSAPHATVPPARVWSRTATVFSLLLLFIVSVVTFWIILSVFDHSSPEHDQNNAEGPPTNAVGMYMERVPGGKFNRQFAAAGKEASFIPELDFSVAEVTRGQFDKFVQATKHITLAETAQGAQPGSFVPTADGGQWTAGVTWKNCGTQGDDLPVTCVTWDDAVAFCNWLSKRENLEPCYARSGKNWDCWFDRNGYRLLTEAEWEYAARAGSPKRLPQDTAWLGELGWFRPKAGDGPHPAAKLASNAGLHDQWGNVWEWCCDWYTEHPKDPTGPATGTQRTVWGGGWNDTPEQVAKQPRKGLPPDYRATDVGFRVVRKVLDR
jgi:serine/threonine protein kinase/formylglycine-generating enzyme required for sulfatase activity